MFESSLDLIRFAAAGAAGGLIFWAARNHGDVFGAMWRTSVRHAGVPASLAAVMNVCSRSWSVAAREMRANAATLKNAMAKIVLTLLGPRLCAIDGEARSFRPVIRGALLTGSGPQFRKFGDALSNCPKKLASRP